MEHQKGRALTDFGQLSDAALRLLGEHLARLHGQRFAVFGSPLALQDVKAGQPISQFWSRTYATIKYLANRYYRDDANAIGWVKETLEISPPPVSWASPVLIDMDPSQFLLNQNGEPILVDTELYVLAPPQLELCAMEYLLGEREAQAVAKGYQGIAPLPPLKPFRPIFRVLLRLLSFQGDIDWEKWMRWPIWFEPLSTNKSGGL